MFLGIFCLDTGVNLRVRLYNSSNTQIATDLVALTLSDLIVIDASPSTIISQTSITQGNFDAAVYSCELTDNQGNVIPFLSGNISLVKEVTR